ncbi:ogr/Delta-like zinc finger family protein [Achromobacter xylosoxidans]|uniref:ogr/Delta-like zinc finger family protein n=1 Tax=Alcaligenes xylosoxydans xylosoxydans TaxID=85698 RepID=UPI0034CD4176|nr:ogr/Delta-like zinc finger family protein [Achromobacter xylosoxidans]
MNQLGQRCPHCDTWATVRHSVELSPTVRALYFQCRALFCGHTWKSHLEMVCTVTPSAVARPSINLPISPKSENLRLLSASKADHRQQSIFGDIDE